MLHTPIVCAPFREVRVSPPRFLLLGRRDHVTMFPYFVGDVSRFGNLEKPMKFDTGTRYPSRTPERDAFLRDALLRFFFFFSLLCYSKPFVIFVCRAGS